MRWIIDLNEDLFSIQQTCIDFSPSARNCVKYYEVYIDKWDNPCLQITHSLLREIYNERLMSHCAEYLGTSKLRRLWSHAGDARQEIPGLEGHPLKCQRLPQLPMWPLVLWASQMFFPHCKALCSILFRSFLTNRLPTEVFPGHPI